MSPGDRPSLPLAEEPFLALHAPTAGTALPSDVVPAGGPFALEEEPALHPLAPAGTAGTAAARLPGRPPTRRTGAGAPAAPSLPATGGALPAGAGLVLLGLGALVRLRRRGQ